MLTKRSQDLFALPGSQLCSGASLKASWWMYSGVCVLSCGFHWCQPCPPWLTITRNFNQPHHQLCLQFLVFFLIDPCEQEGRRFTAVLDDSRQSCFVQLCTNLLFPACSPLRVHLDWQIHAQLLYLASIEISVLSWLFNEAFQSAILPGMMLTPKADSCHLMQTSKNFILLIFSSVALARMFT